jgi:hypothetical protein
MDSKEAIKEFVKLEQQIHSFLDETSALSQKKPNDALNKFKLKFINASLEGMNKFLGDHRPFKDFETFDVDDLPTNSDVVVILSQYTGAIYRFRVENTRQDQSTYEWCWIIKGKMSNVETERPARFNYRHK